MTQHFLECSHPVHFKQRLSAVFGPIPILSDPSIYFYFSYIIELQYRHVNTLITLLLLCRTFCRISQQYTNGGGQPCDGKQKSIASTMPSSVCTYSMTNNELHLKLSKIKKHNCISHHNEDELYVYM